jgi:hypothetical protein
VFPGGREKAWCLRNYTRGSVSLLCYVVFALAVIAARIASAEPCFLEVDAACARDAPDVTHVTLCSPAVQSCLLHISLQPGAFAIVHFNDELRHSCGSSLVAGDKIA